MIHKLKIHSEFYKAVINRKKTFEIRENDRGFNVGDKVILKEYILAKGFTGNYAQVTILYLTDFAQKKGFVVFSFQLISSGYDHKYKEEK